MATSAVDNAYQQAIGDNIKSSAGSKEMGKEEFLTLLVTQFQYQDPLNPMDDKEFIAQLAQFNSLEQMMNLNETGGKILTASQQQTAVSVVSYIGKEVSARGNSISMEKGEATKLQYALAEGLSKGYINLRDSNNELVATITLDPKAPGIHDFDWTGVLSDGSNAKDGVYYVYISAFNEEGKNVIVDTSVTGKVSGVSTYQGEQFLTMNDGRIVSLANVREIQDSSLVKPDPEDPDPENPDPEDPDPENPDPEDPDPELPTHLPTK